jgi:hypothetical protein
MKKSFFLILFIILFVLFTKASPTDSISTTYHNGEFVTYSQVWVNASDSVSNSVINDFNNQITYNIDALFSWALKGMNLRKEKNELMIFYFKSTSFNSKTNVIKCTGDIIVPGLLTLPDIQFYCQVITKKFPKGKKFINVDLLSSNGFIREMNSSFSIIPKKEKEKGGWFTFETRVRFGWFFDFFVTQSRYKSIMEWRINRYMHNLQEEAERREKKSVKNYK